jgi:phospholipid/cholesterol/gamma-HCH transport system substrate-binding protein
MITGHSKIVVLVAVIAALAAASVAAVRYAMKSHTDAISVTAQFDSAAGLYENTTVAVLGMPVGMVTKITPKGGYVEVEFTVNQDVKIPANVSAVTINTSILTDRQIELTPPYRGGRVLASHDTIGLTRTKTPVAFDRVLDVLDKVSKSLRGDGAGGGPVADVITAAANVTDGNGEKIKAALDELSKALRLGPQQGETTRDQLTTIVKDLSSLLDAAARNDTKIRQLGSTTRQLSQILSDEQFGSGDTGRKINELVAQAQTLLDHNRDTLKKTVSNGDTLAKTLVDQHREVSELIDVLPVTLENLYNAIDRNNGAVRAHLLGDKVLTEGQSTKEICNMLHLRQLGCSTGTLQDYGPDFGLTYILDGLAAMGQ